MKTQQDLSEMTLYLTQTLKGYEVIPANWGWHIHKGDMYCGYLEYQQTEGWQGSAFNTFPTKIKDQLKKFAKLDSAFMVQAIA
ncbi:hypothetical protein NUACC21_50290 [Scytonema sp. NUACC21]